MSRVGKLPIEIPEGAKYTIKGSVIEVSGPLGKLSLEILPSMKLVEEDSKILVQRENDNKVNRSLHGLTRSLVNNLFIGVTKGFEKKLIINGLGYKADVLNDKLVLIVGFSHPVEFDIPKGITITANRQGIVVAGIDKQLVGETAARIRRIKKPEPYKGKGIKYENEVIRRKAGKSAVSSGFAAK